jgi:hydroxyacylglutathione hydrolase
MFFQKIKTPGIAHVSYLIGDRGEAAVVDPRRDVEEYLHRARDNNLSIRYIIETHRQEDFVFGSSELARITGAKIVNGRHELFGHGDVRLRDGEEFSFGGLRLLALHTPGHTPESMCYAVFIPAVQDKAWGIFTGDTLFIGEAGRTDLPDPKKTGENAGLLYDAIHQKIAPLGDQALLFPAHGSGSVCGGNIADRDDSTLGLERRYNPVFVRSRNEFIDSKVKERIPRPPYFRLMEKLNLKGGIPLAMEPKEVKSIPPKELAAEKSSGIIIDAREPEAFAGGHIPNSYSIWASGLPVFGGWIANSETPIYLVLSDMKELEEAVLALARIGMDNIGGVLAGGFDSWRNAGLPVAVSWTTTPHAVAHSKEKLRVLDVREDSEFEEEGHIEGASHLYVGYLENHLKAIKPPLHKSEHIVVACSVGHRASLATSILLRQGFKHVENLLGGMTAWNQAGLPKRSGQDASVTTPDVEGERSWAKGA